MGILPAIRGPFLRPRGILSPLEMDVVFVLCYFQCILVEHWRKTEDKLDDLGPSRILYSYLIPQHWCP